MIVQNYELEIFRPKCNPRFQSLHCIVKFDKDIGDIIPYLNAELGGFQFTADPPSVSFKVHGKLITVHPREIAINALKDEQEANKIVEWILSEINRVWEHRDEITPKYEAIQKPNIVEILKYLPKTNCRKCGLPTCMVFATKLAEGAKDVADCPELSKENAEYLKAYIEPFVVNLDM